MRATSVRTNAVFRDVYSRQVLEATLAVHFPEGVILDCTWGKGAFWSDDNRGRVVGMDLAPRYGCLVQADARFLPIRDKAVAVAVFDPPHQHGVSSTTTLRHQEDFSRMPTQADIHRLITSAAPELRRVSQMGAIIKVTDMVEAGRYMPTHSLLAAALAPVLGWPSDLAILDSGVVRPTRHERVLHLRHAHSYFLVYRWSERAPRHGFIYLLAGGN
jgi:hypothetical protein